MSIQVSCAFHFGTTEVQWNLQSFTQRTEKPWVELSVSRKIPPLPDDMLRSARLSSGLGGAAQNQAEAPWELLLPRLSMRPAGKAVKPVMLLPPPSGAKQSPITCSKSTCDGYGLTLLSRSSSSLKWGV